MTKTQTDTQGFSIDRLYDAKGCLGQPIEFRIFDVQYCEHLNEEWLAGAAHGIKPEELRWMLDQGLLRRWKDANGTEGFILYTPEQAKTLQGLIRSKRFDVEELSHIMTIWDDYLEAAVMDEPPYDDFQISDFQHIVRRVRENIEHFESEQERYQECPGYLAPEAYHQQKAIVQENLSSWRRVWRAIEGKTGGVEPEVARSNSPPTLSSALSG